MREREREEMRNCTHRMQSGQEPTLEEAGARPLRAVGDRKSNQENERSNGAISQQAIPPARWGLVAGARAGSERVVNEGVGTEESVEKGAGERTTQGNSRLLTRRPSPRTCNYVVRV